MLKTKIHDHSIWKLQLEEVKKLAESIDYSIEEMVVQTKLHPNPTFILGSGKIEELKEKLIELQADNVIFWNNLTSKQTLNLKQILSYEKEVNIKDRYDLTLEIFEKNATDNLSKMQIELARTRKQLPLYKLEANVTYNKDKAGFRSGGEYAFHSKIKTYDKRIAGLNKEIAKFKENKMKNIENRKKRLNSRFICLTGYYNAGKTTLFNKLTGSEKLTSDKPFTTLSSKYSKSTRNHDLFFIDTIGFVLDLDPRLIKSFELNLLDMQYADKLLYLIDATEDKELIFNKAQYGLNLLNKLDIDIFSKIIIIFNKIEKLENSEEYIENLIEEFPAFFKKLPHLNVSGVNGQNIDLIVDLLINV
ncbi:MAG: HflX family GTPase [Candidatus Lokiarchaeota archaeon]|nr:HflX family GTPase [Candidatus Lokiarchaeota archaeon]